MLYPLSLPSPLDFPEWQVNKAYFDEVKGGQGAHHHHLDDHVQFQPGILSIHKYKGTCYHAYFKKFNSTEVDLGATVSAHMNGKGAGRDHRTFTLSCWRGIKYASKGKALISLQQIQRVAMFHPKVHEGKAAVLDDWANQALKTPGRAKFLFRYRDNNRGKLLPAYYDVANFLARVHEVTLHNDKYLSYHRMRSDQEYLDFSAVDKHEKRQMMLQRHKDGNSRISNIDRLLMIERIVIRFQRAFRRLKVIREEQLKNARSRTVVWTIRDHAAIAVQKIFRGLLVRTQILKLQRQKRLAECTGAVRCGDIIWMEQMITRMGVKIDALDCNRWSLLHHAAATNQEEALVKLIALGADLHVSDKNGNTPLHLACVRRYVNVSRRLVILGADVEACNNKGLSPIARPPFFLQSIVNEIMSLVSKSTPLPLATRVRSVDTHAVNRAHQHPCQVRSGTAAPPVRAGSKGRLLTAHCRDGMQAPDAIAASPITGTAENVQDTTLSSSFLAPRVSSTRNSLDKSISTPRASTGIVTFARDAQFRTLALTPRRASTTHAQVGGRLSSGRTCNTQLPEASSPPSPTLDVLYKKRPCTVGFVEGAIAASAGATNTRVSRDKAGSGVNMFERLQSDSGIGNNSSQSILRLASAGECSATSARGPRSRQLCSRHHAGASTDQSMRRVSVTSSLPRCSIASSANNAQTKVREHLLVAPPYELQTIDFCTLL